MKNLIVNADDLGWTEGVNRGIAEAHRKGLVTSTSLLANGRSFQFRAARSAYKPRVGSWGALESQRWATHCQAGRGGRTAKRLGGFARAARKPYCCESLAGGWNWSRWSASGTRRSRKCANAGIAPPTWTGTSTCRCCLGLFEIALRLAKKHGIRAIRVAHEESKLRALLSSGGVQKTGVVLKQGVQARGLKLLARDAREMADHAGLVATDYFCGIAQTGVLTREGVEQLLKNLPEGTTELMCHPGYAG